MGAPWHRWFAPRTLPVVGIAVSDQLVAVSMRGDPLIGTPVRLTGVYRRLLPITAHRDDLDGHAHRTAALREAAAEVRRCLRVPVGTPAILALEPLAPGADIPLVDGWAARPIEVRCDQVAVAELTRAGFTLERLDARSLAVARVSLLAARNRSHPRDAASPAEIEIAEPVRRHLSIDLDAGAIGAAMRPFWPWPDAMIRAVDTA